MKFWLCQLSQFCFTVCLLTPSLTMVCKDLSKWYAKHAHVYSGMEKIMYTPLRCTTSSAIYKTEQAIAENRKIRHLFQEKKWQILSILCMAPSVSVRAVHRFYILWITLLIMPTKDHIQLFPCFHVQNEATWARGCEISSTQHWAVNVLLMMTRSVGWSLENSPHAHAWSTKATKLTDAIPWVPFTTWMAHMQMLICLWERIKTYQSKTLSPTVKSTIVSHESTGVNPNDFLQRGWDLGMFDVPGSHSHVLSQASCPLDDHVRLLLQVPPCWLLGNDPGDAAAISNNPGSG